MPAFNKIEKQLGLSGALCGLIAGLAINAFDVAHISELPANKPTLAANVSATPVAASKDQATPLVRPLQQTWIF